eukprot:Hpha_TRINITY_DN15125_c3_g8::TRINITY_DN15125_c3_g8_i1::g.126490::m.126490
MAGGAVLRVTDGARTDTLVDVWGAVSDRLCRVPVSSRWAVSSTSSSASTSDLSCRPERSAADDGDRGSAWCPPRAASRESSLSLRLPLGTQLAAIEFAARCAQPNDRGCFQWATELDVSVWDGRSWTRIGDMK